MQYTPSYSNKLSAQWTSILRGGRITRNDDKNKTITSVPYEQILQVWILLKRIFLYREQKIAYNMN